MPELTWVKKVVFQYYETRRHHVSIEVASSIRRYRARFCNGTMVEVVNRQRKLKVHCDRWQAFTEKALAIVPTNSDGLTVAFVSDRAMSELNRMWRHKRGTTDVLSFPADQDQFENSEGANLGDVVISLEQAARQAKENRMSLDDEIAQLILHGMIHLCGYDHSTDKGEMNRLELRLRKKLGI